jgi:hypothetical protein
MTATSRSTVGPPRSIADVDAAWLSRALGRQIASVTVTPFGTGNIAATARVELTPDDLGAGPLSLVAKVPVEDPERRRTAMAWRCYEFEAAFYSTLAPGLQARVPHCYWAGFEPAEQAYAVLLEDLSGWRPGDDLVACDVATADAALSELALLHGARWADPGLAELLWLNRYAAGNRGALGAAMQRALPVLLDRCGAALSPDVIDLLERFARVADSYDSKGFGGPRTIVHGDVRSDNLLIGVDRVCLLDWQTLFLGDALFDVAYCLAAVLPVEARREHEAELVRSYHRRLAAQGVNLSWEQCWDGYRRHGFALVVTALKSALGLDLDGRAVGLIAALAERGARQATDLETLELLIGEWR